MRKIGPEIYAKMFEALLPKKISEFAKKKEGTLQEGISVYVLAWTASVALSALGLLLSITGANSGMEELGGISGLPSSGPAGIPLLIIVSAVGLIVGILVQYVTQYCGNFAAVRFFSGKGRFEKQFYISMLFTGAVMIIGTLLELISAFIPVQAVGAASFLLTVYSFYLVYFTIREVHGIGFAGGIACTVLVLFSGIVFLLLIALVAGAAAALLGFGPAEVAMQ